MVSNSLGFSFQPLTPCFFSLRCFCFGVTRETRFFFVERKTRPAIAGFRDEKDRMNAVVKSEKLSRLSDC